MLKFDSSVSIFVQLHITKIVTIIKEKRIITKKFINFIVNICLKYKLYVWNMLDLLNKKYIEYKVIYKK